MTAVTHSIVIPVYKNAASIGALVSRLDDISSLLKDDLEIVFVVDGSPDDSAGLLSALLAGRQFQSQLVQHSRNFGSFAAIRTGMQYARGSYIAAMAADLQEPPELVLDFFSRLAAGDVDVVVGKRISRDDPTFSRISSSTFWKIYRKLIFRDMPEGGVDIFGCSSSVAKVILSLNESHSSLVGLLFWVGFRRTEVPYSRLAREEGKSGWTFSKKVGYLADSVFSFTDLPLKILVGVGIFGGAVTFVAGLMVLFSFLTGAVKEPGYTPLMLVILYSTFTLLGAIGLVGIYVWRTFENTKQRPGSIVRDHIAFVPSQN
jgi:glycosyltransferase involved in cell wall biosynthesis